MDIAMETQYILSTFIAEQQLLPAALMLRVN